MTLFDAGAPADEPAPGSDGRHHLAFTIAYDGTDFHGFAAQPGQRTISGVLREALEQVLRAEVFDFVGAGRTDAGVHAWGQVVSCTVDAPALDPGRLASSLTRRLAPEIVVRGVQVVGPDFDARHSALARTYRYTIVNRPAPDPFLARHAWWVPEPLDLSALRLGADPFVGEHDFAAFCRKGPVGSTTVRRVLRSHWDRVDDGVLRYEIRGRAFCWQMVRSVVGTLVEIGQGRRTPGDVLAIIRSCDRARAGRLAPPHGLCLWQVDYDGVGLDARGGG